MLHIRIIRIVPAALYFKIMKNFLRSFAILYSNGRSRWSSSKFNLVDIGKIEAYHFVGLDYT